MSAAAAKQHHGANQTTDLSFPPSAAALASLQKLGEGRQAEILVWPPGVVKLFFASQEKSAAVREATTMAALMDAQLPMPCIFGTVTIDGRPGIVMERLNGADLLTLIGRKPWAFWAGARTLGLLHARLHAVAAPEYLPSLNAAVHEQIETSDHVPAERKAFVLSAIDRLPEGNQVCHGDFHPANVIETDAGPKVIDWAIVTRGDALADVARTLLILDSGALPPGVPIFVRIMTAMGRRLFRWRYLRTYRQQRPFDESALNAWNVVNIASRLGHGIAEERGVLLERLGQACAEHGRN